MVSIDTKPTSTSGAGFLDPKTGRLLSTKNSSSTENTESSQVTQAEEASSTADFASQTQNVFGRIRSAVTERANSRISDANERLDENKEAQAVTKEITVALKDLKSAYKEGDKEKFLKIREQLSNLQSQAQETEKKINARERKSLEERESPGFVALGNKVSELPSRTEVSYKAPTVDYASIDSQEDIEAALSEAKETKISLKDNRQAIKQEKQDVREIVKAVRQEAKAVEAGVIESDQDASRLAQKLAKDISQQAGAGANVFVSKLSQDSVQRLLGL
ncbi:MAG: hypothetical protein KDD64_14320 [Bdellovibrionales bacterium]|nr:hypothetical protein [Bdellovibrionales bacterium]